MNNEQNMMIQLDFRADEPLYLQGARGLRRMIEEGGVRAGQKLPPVRILAAQVGVNFNTIARVYRLLEEEGLVYTRQGRGTYVLDSSERGRERELESPMLEEVVTLFLRDAQRMGFTLDQVKETIERVGTGD
jgi:GntR family transcriptional regulator